MRALGFVSAGVESQAGVTRIVDGGQKITANPEDIELQEESDAEDDNEERVEVAQKDVPAAVYGDLANKANKNDKDGDDVAKKREREEPMGALERIKRLRKQ
jgi:pre-mRNA-splicing factor SYF1